MKNRTRVTDTWVQFSAGNIQWNRVNYKILQYTKLQVVSEIKRITAFLIFIEKSQAAIVGLLNTFLD